ncbi:hypothetical protein B0F90DRAFT_1928919 [Multifurca ochricompacta]|uniref:Uncharacterized protein n=1 Tax=Multifurca ochricompacta TaxID=376703 RepID=A0AAD4QJ77_9AGAM|nr:hypothetical protein B0F90DRAFT_1928919 [Multifurca ochricompacta]
MNTLHHSITPQIATPESRKYFRHPLSIDIPNINSVQGTIDNQPTYTAEDNPPVEELMQERSLLEFRDFGISDPQYYLPSTELFERYEKYQTSIGDAVPETGGFIPNDFPVLKAPSEGLNDYCFDVDTQRIVQPVPDARLQLFIVIGTGGFLPDRFPVPKAPSQALNDYCFDAGTQRIVQPIPDAGFQQLMVPETEDILPDGFPVQKAPSQGLDDYDFPVDTQRPAQHDPGNPASYLQEASMQEELLAETTHSQ